MRTNSLARLLIEQGVRRGDRVGIYMNKGLESAVALHGIMKAGGAYVPLDPFAPVARIGFVMRDCGIRHLVTKDAKVEALRQVYAEGEGPQFLIGIAPQADLPAECVTWDDVLTAPAHSLNLKLIEQDLAYILYT